MEKELREADTAPFLEEEAMVGEHCILRSDAGVWDDCRVIEVDAEYMASAGDSAAKKPELRYERRGAQSLKPLILREEDSAEPEPEPEPALAEPEPEPELESATNRSNRSKSMAEPQPESTQEEGGGNQETAPTFRFKVPCFLFQMMNFGSKTMHFVVLYGWILTLRCTSRRVIVSTEFIILNSNFIILNADFIILNADFIFLNSNFIILNADFIILTQNADRFKVHFEAFGADSEFDRWISHDDAEVSIFCRFSLEKR